MNKKVLFLLICVLVLALILVIIFYAAPAVLKMRYKLNYEETIEKYAEKYNLDTSLVCAIIYTESSFNVNARSHVGATGLMQIMPSTGDEIASEIGFANYNESMLADPNVNIEFGCYYIAKMIEDFDGNVGVALAAYNAGPRKALEWQSSYGVNDEGKLTYIPYPETSKYVVKVLRAADVYTMLYGERLEG